MDVAVGEARLAPHIKSGFFAHTLNFAAQMGLNETCVSCLLGQVRRAAAFFYQISAAITVLSSKPKLLELLSHKRIIDVTRHLNSSQDMIERL